MRARHLEVILDRQAGVSNTLLVRLVQRQILVPVAVHDTPDDVDILLLEVLKLMLAVRREIHDVFFSIR